MAKSAKKKIYKSRLETPWSSIGDVLPSVLSSIVRVKNSRPKNIDGIWRAVCDPRYVKYTRVDKVDGDTLYVKVLSGALYSELVMTGSEEVLSKIQNNGVFSSIKRVIYRR